MTGIVALLIVAAVAAIAFWPKAKAPTPALPATNPLGLNDPMRGKTKPFDIDKAVGAGAEVTEVSTPWQSVRAVRQPLARNTHINVDLRTEKKVIDVKGDVKVGLSRRELLAALVKIK